MPEPDKAQKTTAPDDEEHRKELASMRTELEEIRQILQELSQNSSDRIA
jgi:hypothetical protein